MKHDIKNEYPGKSGIINKSFLFPEVGRSQEMELMGDCQAGELNLDNWI